MFPVKIIGLPAAADIEIDVGLAHDVQKTWRAPEETPVAFVYNKINYAVMLATPQDMVDYAIGFSITERIVSAVDQILELDVVHSKLGVDLRIRLAAERFERFELRRRRRMLPGNAGCGVCGVENADEFFLTLPKVSNKRMRVEPDIVAQAIEALPNHQPINQRTRSVHSAAWVNLKGGIGPVREDVGRHNALDKLLGALAQREAKLDDGFVLMSSRCSYEIVEKAARCGVKALASISGPTGFALRKAKEANLALYAWSEAGVVDLMT